MPGRREERTPMYLPDDLVQQLIDRAYELAVTVHYEEVPEIKAEQPVVDILLQIKQQFGLDYDGYDDPHLLLGQPRCISAQPPSSSKTKHISPTETYHQPSPKDHANDPRW
jgi:hypothetical protein